MLMILLVIARVELGESLSPGIQKSLRNSFKWKSQKGFDVESRPDGVVVLLDGVIVAGPFTDTQQVQQAISEAQSHASTDNYQKKGMINWPMLAGSTAFLMSGTSAGLTAALAGFLATIVMGVVEHTMDND